MSTPDYDIHLDRDRFDRMYGLEEAEEAFPFGEDMEEIERTLQEELGAPRKRRRKPKKQS